MTKAIADGLGFGGWAAAITLMICMSLLVNSCQMRNAELTRACITTGGEVTMNPEGSIRGCRPLQRGVEK